MPHDQSLREHLVELLEGGHAHAKFDDAVARFPLDRIGEVPKGAAHSAWEILEHMRIAQNDILRFSVSADYVSPEWPKGYWPGRPAPKSETDWGKSVRAFRKDQAEFISLLRDPGQDLFKKIPWGSGQTILREALLLADHNAYHLGQLLDLRRLLGNWK